MKAVRLARAYGLIVITLLGLAAGACAAPAPLIPRSQMLTADELRPGMKGIGKSVFSGTKIESFGVTVLGVLKKVDFNGDIILISLDSGPPVSKGYGVVAGMSGSPIYIKGKLIGALAYAWSFSKKPIAGVTPIAQMLEEYQPGCSPVRMAGTLRPTQPLRIEGQRIERAQVSPTTGLSPAASGRMGTLVPIATPLLVSGGSPATLARLQALFASRGLTPVAGAGAMGTIKARIEPGAAVGARLVGGDLDLTAVGTVTYAKDGVVLAFGHPFMGLGTTDVPLTAAYVHGILPSSELSFKLASSGQAVGRFTEDRASCLGGKLGGKSSLVETTLRVSDRDRKCARDYHLQVIRNRELTSLLLSIMLEGAVESLGPPSEGTSRMQLALQAGNLPPIKRENTYSMEGEGDILSLLFGGGGAFSPTDEVSQIVEVLQNNSFGEAKVSRLQVAVEISKQRRAAKLERVFAPRRVVRAGDEVPVEIVLRVADRGLVTRTEKITVPASCPPGRLRLGIAGGSSAEDVRGRLDISDPKPESLAQMVDQMVRRPRNNDLVLFTALPTVGVETRGLVFRDLPPAVMEAIRAARSTRVRTLRDHVEQRVETDWVVSGQAVLTLMVEGDQKDKAGRAPSPEYAPAMFEDFGSPFASLFGSLGESSWTRAQEGDELLEAMGEEGDEGGEEGPDIPEMPSWEEVSSAGEREPEEGDLPASSGGGAKAGHASGSTRIAAVWRLTEAKETAQGKCQGVAQSSTGALALAPQMTTVAGLTARGLWSVAVGPDGSVYTGAWADGRLLRVSPQGEVTTVLETPDAVIQSVAVSQDGTVFAAASPSGTIHRLPPRGKAETLCQLDAQNVWALVFDRSGDLWAATGPGGKLYRLPAGSGDPALQFTAPDRHITALAAAPEGGVYCGTSPLGKVYRVSPSGEARSVFEVEKATVQSLAVGADGSVYVGTSPDGRILKLGPEGAARELLKTKERHVLALQARPDGTVWAAAGPEARLYVVRDDKTWSELPRPETDFLVGMAATADGGLYLTAPDTGRLIRLEASAQSQGSYTSPVRDAGATARWGSVRRRADLPAESGVSLWTRSGLTAYPDSTWSDWQQAGESVASPPGRYLQARVDLTGVANIPPRVSNLEVSYLTANRAPEVTLAAPAAHAIWSGKQTVRWSGKDPDKDKLTYEVFWSADGGATWTKLEAPVKPEGKEPPKAEGKPSQEKDSEAGDAAAPSPAKERATPTAVLWPRAARPAAVRPALGRIRSEEGEAEAESEETGEGEERKEGEAPPPAASSATSLSWNTTKSPNGLLLVKVIASDKGVNPLDPRTGETVSQGFWVDNGPPEFTLDPARIDTSPPPDCIVILDQTTYLVAAEMRVDEGEWQSLAAADGIFDSGLEAALLAVDQLPAGDHSLEIRARDAAGNTGTTKLRYLKDSGAPESDT